MASSLVPDYEVKLLLKPSIVLGSNNKLNDTVLSTFSMGSSVKKMVIQFLDTQEQDIFKNGWILRIRRSEGEDEFELTYKKRYATNDGLKKEDAADKGIKERIDTAIKKAQNDGFDSSTSFEAQIEWGYHTQTLSLSHSDSYPDSGFIALSLPDQGTSRKLLTSKAPGKFTTWSNGTWATEQLNASRIYGPVLAKRSKGKWDGEKLTIEIWEIKNGTDSGMEYFVEASFKVATLAVAQEKSKKLADFLQSKGWLLPEDSLKTSLIMKRY
ncbi:hypothetical protein B0J11DRAFT_515190 [Dendryphion nanum]|uniref:CYTH domain-containing protein n=1 Tax=Dendryphion nanum TaxID=256645 RepID=A0A9P9IWY5_9PLEO|nr:hypothetical protein B0J11DRAFT_515190 [Dendryphion nanum]